MADNPLDAVYAYVERVYTRMQAGDVLIRCLEEGCIAPIHEMVEGLVLAGPQSLGALREALGETNQRKAQVQDDLHQVFSELRRVLRGYGISLEAFERENTLQELAPLQLLAVLRQQGVEEPETQEACLNVLHNSRDLMSNLGANLQLLTEIEAFLQDWLMGLAVQSAQERPEAPKTGAPAQR